MPHSQAHLSGRTKSQGPLQIHLLWYCNWTWNCLNLRCYTYRFDWIYGLIFLYIHVYSSCRSLKDAGLSALLHAGSCGLRRWMSSQASSTKHVQSLHVRARRHVLCDAWNMLKWIWNCIFLLAWKGLEWPWEKNGEGERAFWKSVQCLRRALFWGFMAEFLRFYDWGYDWRKW